MGDGVILMATSAPPLETPSPPPSSWGTRIGLLLWAVGTLVLSAYLLAPHLLTLPKPPAHDPRLRGAVAAMRGPGDAGRWQALHILYEGCKCSQRVLDHLIDRGPADGYAEAIAVVSDGADPEAAARARADGERARGRGYRLEAVAPEALASRFGVEAAPLLVVADPAGELRYVGGYTERKQGPVVRDTRVFSELAAGKAPEPLPVFGCAVSDRLRSTVDPLGVR
jgi:hypothetical protein